MEDIKTYLAIALIWLGLMSSPPRAFGCDCSYYAFEALQKIGIKLKTVPSIAVNDWHKYPGAYANDVVVVKDPRNCMVFIHEYVHDAQEEKYGKVKDEREWFKRERDAAIVTAYAAMEGSCK